MYEAHRHAPPPRAAKHTHRHGSHRIPLPHETKCLFGLQRRGTKCHTVVLGEGDSFDPSGVAMWVVAGGGGWSYIGSVKRDGGEVCATATHRLISCVCNVFFSIFVSFLY